MGRPPKNQTLPPKRSLTVGERESIQSTIEEKSQLLRATDDPREGALTVMAPKETGLSKDRLKIEIKRLEETLARESPTAVASRDRDPMNARRRELEARLREEVLETREEIAVINKQHPAWDSAMKKARMRPKYEAMVHEYREICKRLDPDDPNAGSLDAIRKDR